MITLQLKNLQSRFLFVVQSSCRLHFSLSRRYYYCRKKRFHSNSRSATIFSLKWISLNQARYKQKNESKNQEKCTLLFIWLSQKNTWWFRPHGFMIQEVRYGTNLWIRASTALKYTCATEHRKKTQQSILVHHKSTSNRTLRQLLHQFSRVAMVHTDVES